MLMRTGGKIIIATICLAFVMGLFVFTVANASETDGTILATNKWGWGSKIGWVNFSTTNGNVHVTDTTLTGNAWNELYGWIKLDPAQSGVKNTGAGVLSGSAWNEHLGWIDFSGVTINSSGVFVGQAAGDSVGVFNFSCDHCSVVTDWRPSGTRAGGGGGAVDLNPPTTPLDDFKILINNNATNTESRDVKLYLYGGANTAYVFVSENINLVPAEHLPYVYDPNLAYNVFNYTLTDGFGTKNIYVKFCTSSGVCTDVIYFDTINYIVAPVAPPVSIIKIPQIISKIPQTVQEIVEQVKNVAKELTEKATGLKKITWVNLPLISGPISAGSLFSNIRLALPNFVESLFTKKEAPLESVVAKIAPLSMSGKLAIAPRAINNYVFAPLPKEFLALQEQFPEVKATFREVGISRMQDLKKMRSVTMRLPGLTRVLSIAPVGDVGKQQMADQTGARGVGLSTEQLSPLPAVPLSKMTLAEKNRIPTNIIFPRSSGQLVDYKVALTLSNEGKPEQRISTISGKPLVLSVKPDNKVKRVRGYVLFKSRTAQTRSVSFELPTLLRSLSFLAPVLAENHNEELLAKEERLVLMSFDYFDSDGDGIYTADIITPIPAGEYEILTVMDYEDIRLGSKEIRLVTVVDPEGYVFESVRNQELRITGAVVILNWFNTETSQYEQWPAEKYQQDNPQITDVRGAYSFLVPQGMYSIKVDAPGYLSYEGKPFEVIEGGGVHVNIQLKTQRWYLFALDWKTGILFLVVALLGYNFYRDKKRDKILKK